MNGHLFKLISLLKCFNKQEMHRLGQYINSPYFNTPKSAVALYNYLYPIYPRFDEKNLSPHAISKKVNSLKRKEAQAKAGSKLLQTAEDFITLEDWRKDKNSVNWQKLNAFRERLLAKQFETEYLKSIARLDNCEENDIENIFYRHRLVELRYNGFDAKLNRTHNNNLWEVITTLDDYHAVKKLRYLCEAVNRKLVLGIDYNNNTDAEVLAYLSNKTNKNHPYIYAFANVYNMLAQPAFDESRKHYLQIKELAAACKKTELPPSIAESLTYAVNWCLFWNGKGAGNVGNEYLWWVDYKIVHGIFLEKGQIMPITFRNIVSLSVTNNRRPEWIKNFIETYGKHLPADNHDTNMDFAYGLYFYTIKDHKSAVRKLMQASAGEETVFNAIIRRWQFMCAYESNAESTALLTFLEAFEKYVLRHLGPLHQLAGTFKLFITHAKRLAKPANESEIKAAIDLVHGDVFFTGKDWVLNEFQKKLKARTRR